MGLDAGAVDGAGETDGDGEGSAATVTSSETGGSRGVTVAGSALGSSACATVDSSRLATFCQPGTASGGGAEEVAVGGDTCTLVLFCAELTD